MPGTENEDLNMIQPEPTQADRSFEDMLKSSKVVGSTRAVPTTPKAAMSAIQGMDSQAFVDQSMREGTVDPGLDAYQSTFEDTGDVRARNQSSFVKGVKAVGGGIYQGALITLEQVGYLGDIDTYSNLFKEAEDHSGNAWSNFFKEAQDAGRESELFKIYDKDSDENSVLSQIFKWQSLEGAVSSAVGFGLPGLGIASAVSKLGSLKRFGQFGQLLDKTMGVASGSTKAFVGPLASSMSSNYLMGQLMAADTYRASLEVLKGKVDAGEMTELDAQKAASNNAQNVVGLNMALVATAYLRFGGIFKRAGRLNSLVKDPTAMNQLKDMIIKGSPTAFTENVYQEMIQMEQIHKTATEAGVASEYSSGYWDRMSQLALSDRALHAGALGVVGGPIQFAIIQKPLMREQFKAQKEAFNTQQETLTYHKELVKGNLATFGEFDKATKEAIISGDLKAAELIDKTGLIHEVVKSATWGTLDYLRKDIEGVLKLDEKAATELGYDATYKESAEEMLALLDKTEEYTAKFAGAETKDDLIYNRLIADEVYKNKVKQVGELAQSLIKLKSDLAMDTEIADLDLTADFKIKRDKARFDGLTDTQKIDLKRAELKEDKAIEKFLSENIDYENYSKSRKELNRLKKFESDLSNRFKYLISPEGQKAAKDKQNEAVKDAAKRVKDVDAETKEKDAADKDKYRVPFARVKNAAPLETAADKAAREKEWNESVKGVSTIKEGKTFTSIDAQGVSRLYSPNDLLRSRDGRYFRVKGQNQASKSADLKYAAMPVVSETKGENGKALREFVLEDNTFFRDEVLQAVDKKTGGFFHSKEANWAPYVNPDSILRPNNRTAQFRRQEKASEGIADTINNAEYETNRPGPGELLVKTKMAEEYALEELNTPLLDGESYEVTLKLNQEGGVGNTFIDVYKGDTKLTRLDRHSNLNHDIIAALLLKGEVTGTVTEHYTSARNIVVLKDDSGKSIHKPIADLLNMDKKHLPNGKLYLATTPGEGSYVKDHHMPVAISDTGEVITDGYITVKNSEGKDVQLEIPFDGMRVGDTYGLILSPGGRLTPMAMASQPLHTLPSKTGEGTMVDDVTALAYDAINEVFAEIKEDEAAFDAEIRARLAVSNKNQYQQDAEFRKEKFKFLANKRKELEEALETTVYQEIRPFKKMFSTVGTDDGGWIFETNARGKRKTNKGHFILEAGLAKDGTIIPQIQISDGNVGFKHISLESDPIEFKLRLGDRYNRVSIDKFLDVENGPKNAKDLINNSGLTTDVNIQQPFAGASATIEIQGDDVVTQGIEKATQVAQTSRKITSIAKPVTEEIKTATVEKLQEITSFSPDADATNLYDLSFNEDHKEISDAAVGIISSLGLKAEASTTRELRALLEADETPAEYEGAVAEGIKIAKIAGIETNLTELGRIFAFYNKILDGIKEGEVALVMKSNINAEIDARTIQPDGHIFKKGVEVFNSVFGMGIINKVHDGYYFMQKLGSKISRKVYAADTVLPGSKFRKLFDLKQQLSKADPESPGYKILQDKLTVLENKLYQRENFAIKAKKDGDNVGDSAGATTAAKGKEVTGTESIADKMLANRDITSKGKEVAAAVANLEGLESKLDEMFTEDPQNKVTDSLAETAHKLMKDSIPYSVEELSELIDLAREAGQTDEVLAKYENAFQGLSDIVESLNDQDSYIRVESVPVRRFSKKRKGMLVHYIPPAVINLSSSEKNIARTTYDLQLNTVETFKEFIDMAYKGEQALLEHNSTDAETKAPAVSKEGKNKETVKETPENPKPIQKAPAKKSKGTPEDAGDRLNSYRREYEKMGVSETDITAITSSTLSDAKHKELLDQVTVAVMFGDATEIIKNFLIENGEAPFRRGSEITMSPEAFKYEVDAARRMLPQVPIQTIESVVHMVNKYGVAAIGAYDRGVRLVVENAKEGTVYHETFHAVADLHLRPFEKQQIAEENGYQKWNLELEEKLAEQFSAYATKAMAAKGPLGKITAAVSKFFNDLLNWVKGTRSADITQSIFERTVSGGYAKSPSLQFLSSLESNAQKFSSMEGFKSSLSEKDNVTLQNLIDNNKIKIVC